MKIVKERGYNHYSIKNITAGKLFALWSVLQKKRDRIGLGGAEYDCWLQLNRFVENESPEFIKESV